MSDTNESDKQDLLEASKFLNETFKNLNLNYDEEEDFEDTYKKYLQRESGASFLKNWEPKEPNRGIEALDLSNNTETLENSMNLLDDHNNIAMEDVVRQLAELQLRQHQQKSGEVIRNCSNVVVKFDKNNLMNFLESVELALSITEDDANKLTVLKFARQRVTGSVSVASKQYETFDEFKADVLSAFKPKRTVTEIESAIARLTQTDKLGSVSKERFMSWVASSTRGVTFQAPTIGFGDSHWVRKILSWK